MDFEIGGATLPNATISAAGTIDDTLSFPASPTGDVYMTSIGYGFRYYNADPGSSVSLFLEIGPGGTGSPVIDLTAVDPQYCLGTDTCSFTGTLAASDYSSLQIQSAATLVANSESYPNAYVNSGAVFTFARFKADGLTPDTFTMPDPGTWGLSLMGLTLVSSQVIGRRSRAR